jgi:uncharacterized protein involved in exopolysaccharide biosynthesis/Mrp family chromosome partitioning ATPase
MQSVQQGRLGVSAAETDSELDLSALGMSLWRKKWLILIPTALVAVGAFFAVGLITPTYRSEAKIAIEGRENVFLRPEAEKSIERAAADQEAVATQVQVLQSRDIARQVIRELKLTERPEFDPVRKGVSPLSAVLSVIGIGKDQLKTTPEERAMQVYFQRLTVSAVERSRVITIEFLSHDAELAAKIVNAIVDAYMKLLQQAKVEQTRSASAYLASEIKQLRNTVREADAKVDEFRAKANLFVGSNQTSLNTQQLGELTTQLATARAQKADLEARSKAIRDMLKSGKQVESSDITNSDLLKRLIEQRVLLRAQLAEQSSTLLGRHPRIQELSAQISALDVQLRGELERLVASIENDARIAASRIDQTNETIQRLKNQISGSSPQEVELRALEREAKSQRDLLESYLARYREATARENIDSVPAEARVISRATVSNVAVFPKLLPIVAVSALAAFFLMSAFVLSSEVLRQGVPTRRRSRIARAEFGSPSPDTLPTEGYAGNPRGARRSILSLFRRSAGHGTSDAVVEDVVQTHVVEPAGPVTSQTNRIETLATALVSLGEQGRSIVLFGVGRNVGTTHAALELARTLSAKGTRVVLADLALNAPNVSVMSADPQAPGFAELARGTASFGDIITRDKFSRIHLVSTGQVAGDANKILASPRLRITLEALARAYDHLVIDGGAIAETSSARFVGIAPRVVLIAADPAAPETQAAREQLLADGFAEVLTIRGGPERSGKESVAA